MEVMQQARKMLFHYENTPWDFKACRIMLILHLFIIGYRENFIHKKAGDNPRRLTFEHSPGRSRK